MLERIGPNRRNIMTLPNKEELIARANVKPEKMMDPREYPLGYASDLIVESPQVLPEHIHAEVVSKLRDPFSPIYAPSVIEWWAETKEGENHYEFAAVLADAYLELHNIKRLENIPQMFSRRDWVRWANEVIEGK